MKRTPGIWILLSAGVLWLSLQDVYGIRATALIFGKSTTTTTSPAPVPNATDGIDAEVVTESSTESSGKNVTKPTLTGIPQLDYVHDPNLPKELNGYNLSEYPFYERVPDPEEIDFKCDGLHDGFYASITYKCQVYHHCLFGTRYDFLCANYTAFDQKTFICQFVSDVDCVGSKKFWHRNDALYKATTTTTLRPLNIYTTAPPDISGTQGKGGSNPRGGPKRRRPSIRRPQYDYYDDYADYEDDYYEDRPRSNRRRRPRPRPRPIYDDEYEEEYEDDAYERRNRRPYNRRGSTGRRNKNRNKNRNFDEDYEDKPRDRKKNTDDEEDSQNERRKSSKDSDVDNSRINGRKKPQQHEFEDERSKKPSNDDDFEADDSKGNRKENHDEDSEHESRRPSKKTRRPTVEEDYDDVPRKSNNRPRKGSVDENDSKSGVEKPLIVPTTGTIYDRPRVAPRIKPPVPKNEANKYAYKPIKSNSQTKEDEEYYDDYEEFPPRPSRIRKPEQDPITPKSSEIKERKQSPFSSRNRMKSNYESDSTLSSAKDKRVEGSSRGGIKESLDEVYDAVTLSPKRGNRGKDRYRNKSNSRTTESTTEKEMNEEPIETFKSDKQIVNNSSKKKYPDPDYYDSEYEFDKTKEGSPTSTTDAPRKKWKPNETTAVTKPTRRINTKPTPAAEIRKERPDQIVRIVKRPFLPSRGGNPYVARGLQPVGFKAAKEEREDSLETNNNDENSKVSNVDKAHPTVSNPKYSRGNEPSGFEIRENTRPNVETGVRGEPSRKLVKPKFNEPISENDDDFKPIKPPSRPYLNGNNYGGPRTTQKPKVLDRNPLDINDEDYDVTLNDALNPTLPNLPLRSNFPTGFSPANDYTFSAFQRPRYILEPIINSANTDYQVYQPKQPTVQYESLTQNLSPRGEFSQTPNYYSQIVGGNVKRGVQTQPQTYY